MPTPVKGEPLRRTARLVEITGVDFIEAGLRETNAEQLSRRGEAPRDLGTQVAFAIDPVELGAEHLYPHHPRHRGELVADGVAAGLDIDHIAAAEDPVRQLGDAA